MINVTILPATEEEKSWTAVLLAGSEPWLTLGTTLEQCNKVCRDAEYLLFIAHEDGQPRGAIIIHPRGLAGSPYIKSVVVDADHRDRGIGSALLEFTENHFREISKHLFLCVSSFNTRAKKLYEKRGFTQVGEFQDYIIKGESELLMHKSLR
jgi:ribosomal-protein-alanine N-acetyltransferase